MAGLPKRPLPSPATQRHRAASLRVLTQELFQQALLRQLRQSDRFDERFGLALISFAARRPAEGRWAPPIDSLSDVLRPTDVVGWFQEGAVIGLIRPSMDLAQLESSASLATSLEGEIAARLGSNRRQMKVHAEVYSPGVPPHSVASLREAFDHITAASAHPGWRWAKRTLDLAGGVALLTLSSPLLLAVAALVRWTSDGPVLVKQERVGQHGRPFRMLKFRTMHPNAGHEIHEKFMTDYIKGAQGQHSDAPFKLVADPRVTRLGRFLRKSSLDELPQLWNVVKGEMSLVGPRPPLSYEVRCYKPWHRRRMFEAKPGITGLWQVRGRSRTTFDEMVRLDLRYARNQSFWNDLKILLATPRAVITGEGAR